jgi:uncharacterized protein YicC (UPF0701 family)
MRSMTGFATSCAESEVGRVVVELKSFNHRQFKLQASLPPQFDPYYSSISAILRGHVVRGAVALSVQVELSTPSVAQTLDFGQLGSYREQYDGFAAKCGLPPLSSLAPLLVLPGVVRSVSPIDDVSVRMATAMAAMWILAQQAIEAACVDLVRAREQEGAALAQELQSLVIALREQVGIIRDGYPQRAEHYRQRLQQRMGEVLAQMGVSLEPANIVREVALYAERVDVAEEIARLAAHLDAIDQSLAQPTAVGRRLEFLAQEVLREVNTIGAKASSGDVLEATIAAKQLIERLREQLANIE